MVSIVYNAYMHILQSLQQNSNCCMEKVCGDALPTFFFFFFFCCNGLICNNGCLKDYHYGDSLAKQVLTKNRSKYL